jgi:hypothetical protein
MCEVGREFARMLRPDPTIAATLSLALLFTGCGSSNAVRVNGKLLKGGVGYSPPEGHRVSVIFYAMEVRGSGDKAVGTNEPFQAQFNPKESTFEVPGPDGRGIPPGKYRVAVIERLTRDALTAQEHTASKPSSKALDVNRETDFLKNQFGPKTSPIVREVTGSSEILVDLDHPYE